MKNILFRITFAVCAVFGPFFGQMYAAAGSKLPRLVQALRGLRDAGRVSRARSDAYRSQLLRSDRLNQVGIEPAMVEDAVLVQEAGYDEAPDYAGMQGQDALAARAQRRDMFGDAGVTAWPPRVQDDQPVAASSSSLPLMSQVLEPVELTEDQLRFQIEQKRIALAEAREKIDAGGFWQWMTSSAQKEAEQLNREISQLIERLEQIQFEPVVTEPVVTEPVVTELAGSELADIASELSGDASRPHFLRTQFHLQGFPGMPEDVASQHYLTDVESRLVESDHAADLQDVSVQMEQELQELLNAYKAGMKHAHRESQRLHESYNQRYGRLQQEQAKFEQAFGDLFTQYKADMPFSKETFIKTWQNMQGPEQAEHLDKIAQAERPFDTLSDLNWDPNKAYELSLFERAKKTFDLGSFDRRSFDRRSSDRRSPDRGQRVFEQEALSIVPQRVAPQSAAQASSSSAAQSAYVSRVPEGGLARFIPRGTRTKIHRQTFRDLEQAGVPKEDRASIRAEHYKSVSDNLVDLARTEGAASIPSNVLEAFKQVTSPSSVVRQGAVQQGVVQQSIGSDMQVVGTGPVDASFLNKIETGETLPFMFVEYNPPAMQAASSAMESLATEALVPVEQASRLGQSRLGEVVIHTPNKDGLIDTITIDLAQAPEEYRKFFAQFVQNDKPVHMALYHPTDYHSVEVPALELQTESGASTAMQRSSEQLAIEQLEMNPIEKLVNALQDEETVGIRLAVEEGSVKRATSVAGSSTDRALSRPKKPSTQRGRAKDWASWQKRVRELMKQRAKQPKKSAVTKQDRVQKEQRIIEREARLLRQQEAAKKEAAKAETVRASAPKSTQKRSQPSQPTSSVKKPQAKEQVGTRRTQAQRTNVQRAQAQRANAQRVQASRMQRQAAQRGVRILVERSRRSIGTPDVFEGGQRDRVAEDMPQADLPTDYMSQGMHDGLLDRFMTPEEPVQQSTSRVQLPDEPPVESRPETPVAGSSSFQRSYDRRSHERRSHDRRSQDQRRSADEDVAHEGVAHEGAAHEGAAQDIRLSTPAERAALAAAMRRLADDSSSSQPSSTSDIPSSSVPPTTAGTPTLSSTPSTPTPSTPTVGTPSADTPDAGESPPSSSAPPATAGTPAPSSTPTPSSGGSGASSSRPSRSGSSAPSSSRSSSSSRPGCMAGGPSTRTPKIDPFILFLLEHRASIEQSFNNRQSVEQTIVDGAEPFSIFFADMLRSYNDQSRLFGSIPFADSQARHNAHGALESIQKLITDFIVRKLSN